MAAHLAAQDGDDAFGEHLGEVHERVEHEDAVCNAAALVVEYGEHGAVDGEAVVTGTAAVGGKMMAGLVGWSRTVAGDWVERMSRGASRWQRMRMQLASQCAWRLPHARQCPSVHSVLPIVSGVWC